VQARSKAAALHSPEDLVALLKSGKNAELRLRLKAEIRKRVSRIDVTFDEGRIMKKRLIVITALCLALAPAAIAQAEKEKVEAKTYLSGDVVWTDGPAALPAGAKRAVLEGDPGKEGFWTQRFKFPDGYKIAPHTHPQTEPVTVISV
jgi:hypothetical protein